MVWIDADFLLFGSKRKFTNIQWLQLVVALQIRPAPHTTVNHVGEALPVRNLEPSIQRAGDCNTLAGLSWAAQGFLQFFHSTLFLFQLFYQCINGFFCPFFLFISLFPAQQTLYSWASKGEQTGHWRHLTRIFKKFVGFCLLGFFLFNYLVFFQINVSVHPKQLLQLMNHIISWRMTNEHRDVSDEVFTSKMMIDCSNLVLVKDNLTRN